MVVVRAVLHRSLLWQAHKEIGKVKSCAGNRLTPDHLRCIQTAENERTARVAIGLGVDLDTTEVATPAPRVLPAVPDDIVSKGQGLIAQELGRDILQAGEIGEGKIRQAPVEGIIGNTRNSQWSRYVLQERIEILGAGPAAIEVRADNIAKPAATACVRCRGIKTADTGISSYARE